MGIKWISIYRPPPLTKEQKRQLRPIVYMMLATLGAVSLAFFITALQFPESFYRIMTSLPWFLVAVTFAWLEILRRAEIRLGFRKRVNNER